MLYFFGRWWKNFGNCHAQGRKFTVLKVFIHCTCYKWEGYQIYINVHWNFLYYSFLILEFLILQFFYITIFYIRILGYFLNKNFLAILYFCVTIFTKWSPIDHWIFSRTSKTHCYRDHLSTRKEPTRYACNLTFCPLRIRFHLVPAKFPLRRSHVGTFFMSERRN